MLSLEGSGQCRLQPPFGSCRSTSFPRTGNFNGGNALATVVAAPLGSYLGTTIGWCGAFYVWSPCDSCVHLAMGQSASDGK